MNRPTRRSYVAAFAGAIATGVAGCFGDRDGSPTGTAEPTEIGLQNDVVTPTETESSTRKLVAEPVDAAEAAAIGPLTVFPWTLRRWLGDAATGETVRAYGDTYVAMPEPVLPQFDAVRLESPDSEVSGAYEMTAEGGTRYKLLAGADTVDPPADASVTPVQELSTDRREFALAAIDVGERATIYPETELGEWVRKTFFGGYFEHVGETYRGKEVQQTDAEFFSTTAWYVISLSPAPDADDPVTLRLPEIDPAVRGVVDDLLKERTKDEDQTELRIGASADDVGEFAADTEYLLTHPEVLTVEVER